MTARRATHEKHRPLVQVASARVCAPGGRPLFEGLDLQIACEHVAVTGRNGVGKSTLLALLAGIIEPEAGTVRRSVEPHLVPQSFDSPQDTDHQEILDDLTACSRRARALAAECTAAGLRAPDELRHMPRLSHGELRKLKLLAAKLAGAQLLLLDEPSEDLDDAGVRWLRAWLTTWPGGVLMVSHDDRLLSDFRHFLVVRESGGRAFSGTFAAFTQTLADEARNEEQRYARNLHRLAELEARTLHVARRKARKKRYGRCSELDRNTPRMRLNQKREQAQTSHGRLAQQREARLDALREWSRSTRRALRLDLPLQLPVPDVPAEGTDAPLRACEVAAIVAGRTLFAGVSAEVQRERVAIVGPNGSGKTTLLETLLGQRTPNAGTVKCDLARVGVITQGGANWCIDGSLVTALQAARPNASGDLVAQLLVAHKFPLALAQRPLASLSPGERVRAALLCLFHRTPTLEVLVLDEPTFSLDVVGRRAMTEALHAWRGGLVVASHDRGFLAEVGFDRTIALAGCETMKAIAPASG